MNNISARKEINGADNDRFKMICDKLRLSPREQSIFNLRYIDMVENFEEIAEITGYSYSRVIHIHQDVLKKVAQVIIKYDI